MSGRAWLCLGLLVAILWLFQKAKHLFWVFSLLVLPGTFCHECCHFLLGLALNGRPVHFSVIPRRQGDQVQLGEVRLQNLRWYNVFFIGMAPLALLPAAYGLFGWLLGQRLPFGPALLLGLFLVANLAYGSLPSWVDVRLAARTPVGWVLLGGLLVLGWTRFQRNPHLWRAPVTYLAAREKAPKRPARPEPRGNLQARAQAFARRARRDVAAFLQELRSEWVVRRTVSVEER